jgi:heat shock 70kDa protein 4
MAAIGIDLGTQSSLVSVARKRGIDVVANEASNRKTPSIVCFDVGSERALGEAGSVKYLRHQKNSVCGVKRLLGQRFGDDLFENSERAQHACTFVDALDHGSTAPGIGVKLRITKSAVGDESGAASSSSSPSSLAALDDVQVFSPPQLAAMFLSKLGDVAEAETGVKPGFVVVGVPGFFDEEQRRAVMDACAIADLNCVGLISETAATALGYGIYKQWPSDEADSQFVSFVDFGHASLAVSIVAFSASGLRVLAAGYDAALGGRDFDSVIYEWAREQIQAKYGIDPNDSPRASARLRQAAERAKKVLSANEEAPVYVENLAEDIDVQLVIKRDTFESLAQPLLDRIAVPVRACFDEAAARWAKLQPKAEPFDVERLQAVEVTGGSWRIASVQRIMTELYGREVSKTLNPEEAVVRGAAIRCAQICPTFRVKSFKVRDATPYAIDFTFCGDIDASDIDPSKTRTIFPRHQAVPCRMQLEYQRSDPFKLVFRYADDKLPRTRLATFSVAEVPELHEHLDASTKPVCRVTAGLDANGVVSVAAVLEQSLLVPVEKKIPIEKPKEQAEDKQEPDAQKKEADDAEKTEKEKDGDDGGAEKNEETAPAVDDGDEKSKADDDDGNDNVEQKDKEEQGADAATTATDDAAVADSSSTTTESELEYEVVVELKKRVHRTPLTVIADTLGMSADKLAFAKSLEDRMRGVDRAIIARTEARNALEEYVYALRNKLRGDYAEFATDDEKNNILPQLEATEDWLYEDEGENASKELFASKRGGLVALGDVIARRHSEAEERPHAIARLIEAIYKWRALAQSIDEQYAHIEQADRDTVSNHVVEAEQWLNEKQAAQDALAKHVDPALFNADIDSRLANLSTAANAIMSKPKPAPKKEEEKKQPDGEAKKDGDAAEQKKEEEDEVGGEQKKEEADEAVAAEDDQEQVEVEAVDLDASSEPTEAVDVNNE